MNGLQLPADRGRVITAAVFIALGAMFLIGQVFPIGILWPLFVVIPGLAFLYFGYTGGKNQSGLAIPGWIITGTGALLMYQSITNHWESWAYAWTLYPVFVGMGLNFVAKRTGDANAGRVSQGLIRWGGMAFIVAAVFFELLIFNTGGWLGRWVVPALLIGVGALMLTQGKGKRGSEKSKRDGDEQVLFTGAAVINGKSKNGTTSASLREQIDAALAEDDEEAAAH